MAQNITTIVLKTTDEQGGTGDQEYTVGDFTENQDKLAKNRKKILLNTIHNAGVETIQEIMTNINYDINNYVALTENYKLRVQMDNVSSTVGKVNSLASSIMSGAITGAQIYGGAGAAIGAAIGLIKTGVSEGLNIVRQHASQSLSLATNDIQAGYSQSRLGLIDNGRGTQN